VRFTLWEEGELVVDGAPDTSSYDGADNGTLVIRTLTKSVLVQTLHDEPALGGGVKIVESQPVR